MATINNPDLQELFTYIVTVENIVLKEIKLVNGNRYHLDKLVPEDVAGVYTKKETKANEFVDSMYRKFYEAFVVSLVAVFERVVFAKYKTSYGEIKTTVSSDTPKTIDFYRTREKIIGEANDKLHAIIIILDGQIDNDLLKKLKVIKDQRDFIAHGGRFGAAPTVSMKLHEIAEALDSVLNEVEINK
ncbi:MAG: hypothetical protein IPG89_07305 [Bacteroidetes bacterium]|nr:hypothetical protein [Bacteroidota bacterium]